jgi:ribosomal protein L11 methyltransferase
MDDFKPMAFGKRLWICPSWHTPPDKDAVNIFLDPGLAFGSGTHPTTALCLEWLEGCPLQDKDLIDYGCGSGILAIAGLKLGAQHAWGVDNDPQALKASQVNAEKNSVKERLITYLPEQMPDIEADVLVANILANPLIELRDKLAHLVRPGGHIALSGILEEQQEQVMQAYSEHFQMAPATIKEGWVRLEGRRN